MCLLGGFARVFQSIARARASWPYRFRHKPERKLTSGVLGNAWIFRPLTWRGDAFVRASLPAALLRAHAPSSFLYKYVDMYR